MSFVRYLLPSLVIATAIVVAACSGSDGTVTTSSGNGSSSSSGSVGSSGGSSSSGLQPYPTDAGPSSSSSSSSGGAIDPDGVVSLTMRQDECVKPPGKCFDAQGFTVDFVNSQLTTTTCVELAGGSDAGAGRTDEARTTKKLSPGSVATIKKALGNIVINNDPAPAVAEGHSWLLSVSSKTQGNQSYSGWPGCEAVGRIQIETGWEQLWDTIRAQ